MISQHGFNRYFDIVFMHCFHSNRLACCYFWLGARGPKQPIDSELLIQWIKSLHSHREGSILVCASNVCCSSNDDATFIKESDLHTLDFVVDPLLQGDMDYPS